VLDPSFEPALGAFFNPPSAPASASNFWRRLAGALAVAALIALAAYFVLTNPSSLRRGGPSATDLVAKAAAQTPTPAASQAAEQKEPASNPAPNAGAMTSARSVDPAAAPFTLQVGAHATEAKARQVAASLTEAGLEASVELPGRSTWYRVHVGAFAGRAEAERYGAQLRREGKIQEFLVTDRRQP
jgi:cell division septation protein DedD